MGNDQGKTLRHLRSSQSQSFSARSTSTLSLEKGGKRSNLDASSHKKKAKLPEGAQQEFQTRDRLLSCPDFHHHTESELVRRIEHLLAQKVQPSKGSAEKAATNKNALEAAIQLFDGANPPKISVNSYLQRLIYYLGCIAEQERKCGIDVACHSDLAVRYVLVAIMYVERIQARTGMQVTLFNVHRLLITGIMVAAKVLDDLQPNQKYFADLGGVSTLELSRLEAGFLLLCDYNVNVDPTLFAEKYASALQREQAFSDVAEALTLGAVFSPKITPRSNTVVA